MPIYLVERYVPSMTEHDVASATTRVGGIADVEARHLWTVLVPGEDTSLSLFEAPDAAAVEAANARASLPVDRIVRVALFASPAGDRGRSVHHR